MDKPKISLYEYASIDGSELGELCQALLDISDRLDYAITDGLTKAIHDEIDAQQKNFDDNATITETELVYTRTNRALDWK